MYGKIKVEINILILILYTLILLNCNEKEIKLDERCIQEPKYGDNFLLPPGLIGYNNYEYGLDCARKTEKPIALYFNGIGHKQSRNFEEKFLTNIEIAKKLNSDFIFVSLLVDDKRELPEEAKINYETVSGEVRRMKTIGNLNISLLTKYNHSTSPTLFLVDISEKIIARITIGKSIEEFQTELEDIIK